MVYLGLWVTHEGVKTININIQAIINKKPHTLVKELCKFKGVVN